MKMAQNYLLGIVLYIMLSFDQIKQIFHSYDCMRFFVLLLNMMKIEGYSNPTKLFLIIVFKYKLIIITFLDKTVRIFF